MLHGSAAILGPPTTWQFVLLPALAYTVERLMRVHRASHSCKVLEASIQADTLSLVIERPPFVGKYLAGQYVFLNVPALSLWQWHPFSLTSCDADPYLSVCIKRAGDWTGALFEVVEPLIAACAERAEFGREHAATGKLHAPTDKMGGGIQLPELRKPEPTAHVKLPPPPSRQFQSLTPAPLPLASIPAKDQAHQHTLVDVPLSPTSPRFMNSFLSLASSHHPPALPTIDVRVDGIFGAPSQDFFAHDHVIFIATGVGVTPFLSILGQIQAMVRAEASARRTTAVIGSPTLAPGSGSGGEPALHQRLKRVDLYWLNRDQAGFQWMAEALRGVDPVVRKVLRVHTFLTCAKGGDELASFLLWWGLEQAKRQRRSRMRSGSAGECLLTGLKHSGVYWGRPHWESLLMQTAMRVPGKKVGVFFCGPKALGKELRHVVRKVNAETNTTFTYEKENF